MVVSPKILDNRSTGSVSIIEGEEAKLQCKAEGVPPPRIFWRRSGQPQKGKLPLCRFLFFTCMQTFLLILLPGQRESTLTIKNATRYDMGEYECIARNGIPPAKSKVVQLYVNCKCHNILEFGLVCLQVCVSTVASHMCFSCSTYHHTKQCNWCHSSLYS